MFASVRHYRMTSGSMEELVRRVDDGFAEEISVQPGFLSYEFVDCGNGEIVTVSLFSEEQQAQASRQLAASWTKRNLAEMQFNRLEALHGAVMVSRARDPMLEPAHAGGKRKFASLRRYQLRGGSVDDLMHIVDDVFADLIEGMDGFEAYHALDCASDEIMSSSMFRDQACAEESDDRALQFVSEYLHRFDIERTEVLGGEVLVSRAVAPVLQPAHA
jgi:heme-degrading monooxygenase HmoA